MKRTFLLAGCILTLSGCFTQSMSNTHAFIGATRAPYRKASELSMNGRSISEMKQAVEEMWPQIELEKEGEPVVYHAILKTSQGEIELELTGDKAENHVRNFISLSRVGFYDGLLFHRCIKGFMVQTGCPVGDGSGGPGYCIKPEFNTQSHQRGAVSMARRPQLDSAGSQFFICSGNPTHLDGTYTVFGKVVRGMETVDKIANAPTVSGDYPVAPVRIDKVEIITRDQAAERKTAKTS